VEVNREEEHGSMGELMPEPDIEVGAGVGNALVEDPWVSPW
jgi:hypothetical protein